ncbi:uncharacterized protein LOC122509245 [Leptopilina heterotoma]|uniref:uncharacterized protein LOC122509245 n=1 Tax=Leptopilina heterotoma TaxID=63436 RepID=UPI001CA7E02C|nr:uncharacterized protein LOC122509245 [Leptopilina heterotoma]
MGRPRTAQELAYRKERSRTRRQEFLARQRAVREGPPEFYLAYLRRKQTQGQTAVVEQRRTTNKPQVATTEDSEEHRPLVAWLPVTDIKVITKDEDRTEANLQGGTTLRAPEPQGISPLSKLASNLTFNDSSSDEDVLELYPRSPIARSPSPNRQL